MECFRFPAFQSNVFVSLFTDLKDPGAILARIQRASKLEGVEGDRERAAVNFALIDAKTIVSAMHLHTAVLYALLAESQNNLRTKTIHSEIIWGLNPTKNITDALRQFGVSAKTQALLVVRVQKYSTSPDIDKSIEQEMKHLCDGALVPLNNVAKYTDWSAVRKIYKLNEDVALQDTPSQDVLEKRIEAIVISTVATKNVQS